MQLSVSLVETAKGRHGSNVNNEFINFGLKVTVSSSSQYQLRKKTIDEEKHNFPGRRPVLCDSILNTSIPPLRTLQRPDDRPTAATIVRRQNQQAEEKEQEEQEEQEQEKQEQEEEGQRPGLPLQAPVADQASPILPTPQHPLETGAGAKVGAGSGAGEVLGAEGM